MLGAVTVRRLRTVIVSIILLLIVIVFLNNKSLEESNELSIAIEDTFIQPIKQTLKATTEEYDDYEEIEIPLWGEFIPTDVRFEKDIFFLETSGKGTLTGREGCVIESALKFNKHRVVWVLLAGANSSSIDVVENNITRTLLYYENVRLRYFNLTQHFASTKLWSWFVHSDWHRAQEPARSQVLWLATASTFLYRHGGTALAWDSLTVDSLSWPRVPDLGLCEDDQLAVNVLSFPAKHVILDNIFTRAEKSPTLRSFNELSIQDEILRLCKAESMKDLKFKKCVDFNAISPEERYCPIEKSKSWTMFDEKRAKIAEKQIIKEKTKVVNLWLEESSKYPIWSSNGFKSFIFKSVSKYCPFIAYEMNNKL